MHYPLFFNTTQSIELYDPLSEILGAFDDGMITFSYLDAVKLAGHSCPTVAGAYLMAQVGLQALYKDEVPQRGMIELSFRDAKEDGVTGVVANVISMITGAADVGGFKGLNKKFARHSLLDFSSPIEGSVRLRRIDTNKTIEIEYNPSSITASPAMQPLMQKVLTQQADANEKREFARLWQERVEKILQRPDVVICITETA